jgi:hypothetical protein
MPGSTHDACEAVPRSQHRGLAVGVPGVLLASSTASPHAPCLQDPGSTTRQSANR